MAIQLQLRRGEEEDNDLFIGAPGEVTVDTTKNTLRVHDGATQGGYELAKATLSNAVITKSLTPRLSGQIDVGTITNKWRDLYLSNTINLGTSSISDNASIDGIKILTGSGKEININQSLSNVDSPTFNNLTIQGKIFGYEKTNPFFIVPTYSDLAEVALDEESRMIGMVVLTRSDNRLWQLKNDLQTWQEYVPRPIKQEVEYSITTLDSFEINDFEFEIGNSVIAYKVELSHPFMFEVYETAERDQSNPYKFIATLDHLIDDGSTILSDGSILRGRRYHIWSSFNAINKLYCRVTNITDTDAQNVSIKVTYSVLEYSSSV